MGDMIDFLRAHQTGMELRSAAVVTFTRTPTMRAFYTEYITYVRTHGKSEEEKKHPEKIAKHRMLDTLTAYGPEKLGMWKEAVPELLNPLENLVRLLGEHYSINQPSYHTGGARGFFG